MFPTYGIFAPVRIPPHGIFAPMAAVSMSWKEWADLEEVRRSTTILFIGFGQYCL